MTLYLQQRADNTSEDVGKGRPAEVEIRDTTAIYGSRLSTRPYMSPAGRLRLRA